MLIITHLLAFVAGAISCLVFFMIMASRMQVDPAPHELKNVLTLTPAPPKARTEDGDRFLYGPDGQQFTNGGEKEQPHG